jgi:hypothetical protein
VRGELDARDKQLGDTVAEIEKLREDQHSLKGEVRDRGSAIVTLQTELEKVRGEVLERDVAIANLKTELEVRGEDKQLNLFPPEPTPEPTPEPEPVTASPVTASPVTVTVETPGLVEYINLIAPGSGITTKVIGNAITRHLKGAGESGKGRNLCSLESDYKFKYLGKSDNKHKFSIPNL